MKIVLIKTVWGCPEMGEPALWGQLLRRVKREGFHGVEVALAGVPKGREEEFGCAVRDAGLRLIAQIHTCGYVPRPGPDAMAMGTNAQGVVGSQKVDDHVESLREGLETAKRMGAELANCHSGHDSWSLEKGVEYLNRAASLAAEAGVRVAHETHRRRLLWNPWQAWALTQAVPSAQVTADLSHWVCACERVFSAESDAEWPEILRTVASRAALIHARVGYNEGPQIPHPAAREARFEVEEHISWWKAIIAARAAAGDEEVLVEPEFGAPGYQRCTPFTRVPEGDLWEINSYMAARLVDACRGMDGVEAVVPEPMAAVMRRCDAMAERAAAEDAPAGGPTAGLDWTSVAAGAALGLALGAGAATMLMRKSV